jgi:hypothetical protein
VEEPSTTPVAIGEGSKSNSKLLYIEVRKKFREINPNDMSLAPGAYATSANW